MIFDGGKALVGEGTEPSIGRGIDESQQFTITIRSC
jgi:hypothetical protein